MAIRQTGHDASDVLQNKKLQILQFHYVPGGNITLSFKAFLTDFSDQYRASWSPDTVYGRMDPLATYTGTQRVMRLGWSVPAFDSSEAVDNLRKMSTLINMTYPVYGGSGLPGEGAGQISGAPLIKLKFGNLITDIISDGNQSTIVGDAKEAGLLGWLDGITMSPDLDAGFHDPGEDGQLYPMLLNLSCNFHVLHQHKLGWEKKSGVGVIQRTMGFPYGESLKTEADSRELTKADPQDALRAELGELGRDPGSTGLATPDFAIDCNSSTPGPDGLGAQVEEKCNQAPINTPKSNVLESIVNDIFGGL